MILGIEHTAIACFDPHRLADWYIHHLKLVPLLDTGKTVYLQAANGVVLEFVHADAAPLPPAIRDAGLRHIAFSVTDFDAACEQLRVDEIELAEGPIVMAGMRLQFFKDPEGNFLHLVERDIPLR